MLKKTSLLTIVVALSACSPAMRGSSSASPNGAAARTGESRVFDSKAGKLISSSELAARLAASDVVFFGEQHDDPATHRAELAFLARVGALRPNLVLSLEMFERDVQGVVDGYLSGAITDSILNATSRPWPRYVTDYRPLVELARANGWPVVAANVPRRIASIVSRAGLKALDTIPAADRAMVARDVQCPHDRYFDLFAEEMTGHSAGATPGADAAAAAAMTNRFYEAQCVKDETMAESIASALTRSGGGVVMHFNGAFHSNMSLGTAARVRRRLPNAKMVVVTAVPVPSVDNADPAAYKNLADYIILTPAPRVAGK